jgi:hypothetical protein
MRRDTLGKVRHAVPLGRGLLFIPECRFHLLSVHAANLLTTQYLHILHALGFALRNSALITSVLSAFVFLCPIR